MKKNLIVVTLAAKNGCNYLTFNVPNAECQDCGFIAKQPFDKCPKCGSDHVDLYDRIIGYAVFLPVPVGGYRLYGPCGLCHG